MQKPVWHVQFLVTVYSCLLHVAAPLWKWTWKLLLPSLLDKWQWIQDWQSGACVGSRISHGRHICHLSLTWGLDEATSSAFDHESCCRMLLHQNWNICITPTFSTVLCLQPGWRQTSVFGCKILNIESLFLGWSHCLYGDTDISMCRWSPTSLMNIILRYWI